MIKAILKFKELVDPDKTRIESLFPLILVFGGNADVKNGKYSSCRNVFLHWASDKNFSLEDYLRTPEQFQEWNSFDGYSNLVDFEKEAGCLARGILLFSECPGALAELGAFCTDEVLCERLVVVIAKEHYEVPYFISLGPIKRIEYKHGEKAICVINATKDKKLDAELFEAEVEGVGKTLLEKVSTLPKTQQFVAQETRNKYLLIADLVELFGALDEAEIGVLLAHWKIDSTCLKRMLNLLVLFELIQRVPINSSRYYTPPKQRTNFLDHTATAGSRFERASFRLLTTIPELKKDRYRLDAYSKIHGMPR